MSKSKSRAGRAFHETIAPYAAGEPSSLAYVKLSISLPADLVEVVRAAAEVSGLSVSATIAAALRRTVDIADQERLDAALALDREENLAFARAYQPIAAELLSKLEW